MGSASEFRYLKLCGFFFSESGSSIRKMGHYGCLFMKEGANFDEAGVCAPLGKGDL